MCLVAACIALTGCPQHGLVHDGTSISYGPSNRGTLIYPTRLPDRGEGYWTPRRWATRGLRYGTDELISLLVYVGRRIERESPGARVGIADLSPRRGGPSAWHRSHQTGRDADLLFFATDITGTPIELRAMLPFASDGTAVLPPGHPGLRALFGGPAARTVYFDVARNWLLVRALIENPVAPVQFLFISDALKQMLIDHARAVGEPEHLIQKAGFLLHQPGDSLPHNDHIHVRIYCAPSDRVHGCRDRGVLRWVKKDYKYDPVMRVTSAIAQNAVATAAPTPMPAMLVLGAFPFRP